MDSGDPTPQISERRRRYLDAVFAAIPVEPFTKEMGQLMAKIDAEARKNSLVLPFADLQIGVTALHFDHGIVTWNVRHFKMIPGLRVVQPG